MESLPDTRTPWHKPLKGKLTSPATIRSTTKTNFDVERTEVFVDLTPGEEESTFLAVPGLFCLVRADTRRPISPIGPNTKIAQLGVWAETAHEVAKEHGEVTTGGVLGSEHAYYVVSLGATGEYDLYVAVVPEIGTTKAEGIFFNSHAVAKTTHIVGTVPLRHTGDSALLAKTLINAGAPLQARFDKACKTMLKTKINPATPDDITRAYGAVWSPEDRSSRAQARWKNRLDEITQAWDDSIVIADYRNTVYGFYVALHEWSEYGRSFRGTGGDAKAITARRPTEALLGLHRTVSENALATLPLIEGSVPQVKRPTAPKPAAKATKAPAKARAKKVA